MRTNEDLTKSNALFPLTTQWTHW